MSAATRVGLGVMTNNASLIHRTTKQIFLPTRGAPFLRKRSSPLRVYTDGSKVFAGVGAAARAETPFGTIVMKEHLGCYDDWRSTDAELFGAVLGLRIVRLVAERSRVAPSATMLSDCEGAIYKLRNPAARNAKDEELMRRFEEELRGFRKPCSIKFAWVRGHAGTRENELVDLDARAAALGESSVVLYKD